MTNINSHPNLLNINGECTIGFHFGHLTGPVCPVNGLVVAHFDRGLRLALIPADALRLAAAINTPKNLHPDMSGIAAHLEGM